MSDRARAARAAACRRWPRRRRFAQQGNVVIVKPGVYREALRAAQGTTWRGEPGAVIDGGWDGSETTEAEARANAVLIRAAGVTLEGIEIRNVKGNGVAVGEGGHNFTMRRCEISPHGQRRVWGQSDGADYSQSDY